MGSQFEGRRLTLVRLSDGTRFGGWSVKKAGDKWVLQLNEALPELDDTVRVVFYDDGHNGVTLARVCIVHGQNVVLQVRGKYNTVAANQEGRFRLHGITAVLNPASDALEVSVVDYSRSGFGFESSHEVAIAKSQAFAVNLGDRVVDVVGEIVHVREIRPGVYRGGVKLRFELRRQMNQWYSDMKNVSDRQLNSGKTGTG